jgi:hypothetical protein
MEPTPLTRSLPAPGPFWTFNREERNAVAILFGLLTGPGNVEAFARLLDWQPADLPEVEVCVEWTYLRDLWSHHSRTASPDTLRTAILDALQPADGEALRACSPLEFNTHFGAVPKPSSIYLQSPGNWSVAKFDPMIGDDEEFRRACVFKWAFNVKPDLVLRTPSGKVLCIEAKWDSGEGSYPSNEKEKRSFVGVGSRTCPRPRCSGTSSANCWASTASSPTWPAAGSIPLLAKASPGPRCSRSSTGRARRPSSTSGAPQCWPTPVTEGAHPEDDRFRVVNASWRQLGPRSQRSAGLARRPSWRPRARCRPARTRPSS